MLNTFAKFLLQLCNYVEQISYCERSSFQTNVLAKFVDKLCTFFYTSTLLILYVIALNITY